MMIYVPLPVKYCAGKCREEFQAMLDNMVGQHNWYFAVQRHGDEEWGQWLSEEGILFRNAEDAVAFRLKTGV